MRRHRRRAGRRDSTEVSTTYLSPISCDAARRVRGLLGVEPAARVAGVDRAEAAGARADLAHQHDRGGAGVPALADVRALGFLADRRQPVLAHRAAHVVEAAASRHRSAQPGGLAARRQRRPRARRLDAVLDRGEALSVRYFSPLRAEAVTTGMPLSSLMCSCAARCASYTARRRVFTGPGPRAAGGPAPRGAAACRCPATRRRAARRSPDPPAPPRGAAAPA